jgi:hypothetical protein
MKVLFLDIDGVLNYDDLDYNPQYQLWFGGDVPFCSYSLDILRLIVETFGYKIVLSTSWRYGFDQESELKLGDNCDRLVIKRALGAYGLDWIDITPDLWGQPGFNRGKEIMAWLNVHPEVTSYIILDDMGNSQFPTCKENLIRTDHKRGLTYHEYKKIQSRQA